MRHLLAFVLMIALVGSAAAADLGNVQKDLKNNSHVGMNPGTPDGREGGEDMASAVVVAALPYTDSGNTLDNLDDYDAACPYTGSTSADVLYSFTPAMDMYISVDLCGSSYDTKTYVFDAAFNLIACNDDAYFDEICGSYVSAIDEAALIGGTEYFITVDGYGGDAGDYMIALDEITPAEPCVIVCDGLAEGEPHLGDDYADAYNGGCNSPEFDNPFQDLTAAGDANGELTFCGTSGWYLNAGVESRDTDWSYFVIGESGSIEWTLDAEQLTTGYLLAGNCVDGPTAPQDMLAGPCAPATMIITGTPGDVVMLWVGPSEFTAPAGFDGPEYSYVSTFTGLDATGVTATEGISFDGIKSLYR